MKTLKFLSSKKYKLVLALLVYNISVEAQTATILKNKTLQMGIFAEGFREFRPADSWDNPNIGGLTTGLAFRYRLSRSFQVSAGLGVSYSIFGFKERDWDGRYYGQYEQSTNNFLGDKRRETLLRLPVSLQTNIYKQKIFVSGGFELFKRMSNIVTGTYQDVRTNELIKNSYNYGASAIDIHFCAGMGWNFKSFSIESNIKFFTPLSGFKSAAVNDIFSPSLRLIWYFIK